MQTHHIDKLCNSVIGLCSVLIFFAIKGTPYIPDKWIAIGIGLGIALFALAKITNGIPFSIGIGFSSKTGYIQKSAWFDRLCYITSLIVLGITIGRAATLYAL